MPGSPYRKVDEAVGLPLIIALISACPPCGYRRVTHCSTARCARADRADKPKAGILDHEGHSLPAGRTYEVRPDYGHKGKS
jgi:hypothetical protein